MTFKQTDHNQETRRKWDIVLLIWEGRKGLVATDLLGVGKDRGVSGEAVGADLRRQRR
jgi:hypothetical protein